jgi:Holliday junction resolvase RusA-like endonuclease
MDNYLDYKEPTRGKLLKLLYIATTVKPLARPRANFFTKAIYQPLETQKELRHHVRMYADHNTITVPIIVDTLVFYPTKKNALMVKSGDIDNITKAIYDALQADYGKKYEPNKIIDNDILILGGTNMKVICAETGCLIRIWEAVW